jgi:Fur family transcriptional regulator, ferric uptake regulator
MMKGKNESLEEFIDLLNAKSQRITAPRLEILKILRKNHHPLTITEIHKKLKTNYDLATVYRTVNLFLKIRLVSEIDFKDEFKRYELVYDRHHHHHVICRKCRKVEDVDACILQEVEKDLKKKGYKEISHSLEFFGVCEECQAYR